MSDKSKLEAELACYDGLPGMTALSVADLSELIPAARSVLAQLDAVQREAEFQRHRAETAEVRCYAEHPTNPTVVPCTLRRHHADDHYSTTGCAGSGIHWPLAELDAVQARNTELAARIDRVEARYQEFRRDVYEDDWFEGRAEGLREAMRILSEDSPAAALRSVPVSPQPPSHVRYEPCVLGSDGQCHRASHSHPAVSPQETPHRCHPKWDGTGMCANPSAVSSTNGEGTDTIAPDVTPPSTGDAE